MGSSVGPLSVFALSFGTIVGIVWVFLLGTWIRAAGPVGTAVGIVIGALAMLPIALCYTRIVARFPGGGGEVRYGLECFGGPGALLAAWLLFMAYTGLASFCLPLFQWLAEVAVTAVAGPALAPNSVVVAARAATWSTFAVIVVANYRGLETAAWLQDATVILLILLTAGLGITAAVIGRVANLEPAFGGAPAGPGRGFAAVLATTPFLFAGFNTALQALGATAGGGRDRRTIQALLGSVLAAAVFYAGVVLAIPATLPRAELLTLDLPALEAVGRALDSRAAVAMMGLLAGLGLLTSWNALVFAASRVFGLLGRSGVVPGAAAGRMGPAGYVGVIAVSSALLSLAGRTAVGTMVTVVSLCMTGVFLLVAVGVLRLELAERRGRSLVPALGVAAALILLGLGLRELPASAAAAPLGAGLAGIWLLGGGAVAIAQAHRGGIGARFRTALADHAPHAGEDAPPPAVTS